MHSTRHAALQRVASPALRRLLSEPLLPVAAGTVVLAAALATTSEALLALSCGLLAGYSLSGST